MTILVSTYVQEGIVMGADSRLKEIHNIGGKIEKRTISDNMTKLFLLKKIPIGISLSGEAYVNNNLLSEFIKVFEDDKLKEIDNIESASLKLMAYLQEANGDGTMRLQMCGYHNRVPYVYLIDKFSCVRFNNGEDNKVSYNVLWSGEGEAISNLLLGEYPTTINFHFMPLKDAIDFTEFLIDVVIKRNRFHEGLSTCGGSIDLLVLTPEDQYFYKHKLLKP